MTAALIRVAAFYRFAAVPDRQALAAHLRAFGAANGLRGSIIVAEEGANGTIVGAPEAVDALFALLRAEPGFEGLAPRFHDAPELPFARWKVKVKREIVTMGVPVDAAGNAGVHVAPAAWNALIADPGTILIDTRNDYEVAIGTFDGAIDPRTASFGDFPAWFDAQAAQWRAEGREPRIAMFCTGGIRCEKSTAYARAQGFDQVYHLEGGILAYLAEIEAADSKWRGECFLFDERVSLTHGEEIGDARLCATCGQPVLPSADHDCAGLAAGELP
ncbi:MAG: rhodanese domain-containing protein [Sphingobium sp.]|nr:rhodanese domain-containing protein [Sphingobium sp.]